MTRRKHLRWRDELGQLIPSVRALRAVLRAPLRALGRTWVRLGRWRGPVKRALLYGALAWLGFQMIHAVPARLDRKWTGLAAGPPRASDIARMTRADETGRWPVVRGKRVLWHVHPDMDLSGEYFRDREARVARLEEYYGTRLRYTPHAILFPDLKTFHERIGYEPPDDSGRPCGSRPQGVVVGVACTAAGAWIEAPHDEPEHEPAHLLTHEVYPEAPRFLHEGLSEWLSLRDRGPGSVHRRLLGNYRNLPSLAALQEDFESPLADGDTWTELDSYDAAGSFVGFLHDRYGKRGFQRWAYAFQRYPMRRSGRPEPEMVFGLSKSEMEASWRRYLESLVPRPSPDGTRFLRPLGGGLWALEGRDVGGRLLSERRAPEWTSDGRAVIWYPAGEERSLMLDLESGEGGTLFGTWTPSPVDGFLECRRESPAGHEPGESAGAGQITEVMGVSGGFLGSVPEEALRLGDHLVRAVHWEEKWAGYYSEALGGLEATWLAGLPEGGDPSDWSVEPDGDLWILWGRDWVGLADPADGLVAGPWAREACGPPGRRLAAGRVVLAGTTDGQGSYGRRLLLLDLQSGEKAPIGRMRILEILDVLPAGRVAVRAGRAGDEVWLVDTQTGEENLVFKIPSEIAAWRIAGNYLYWTEATPGAGPPDVRWVELTALLP